LRDAQQRKKLGKRCFGDVDLLPDGFTNGYGVDTVQRQRAEAEGRGPLMKIPRPVVETSREPVDTSAISRGESVHENAIDAGVGVPGLTEELREQNGAWDGKEISFSDNPTNCPEFIQAGDDSVIHANAVDDGGGEVEDAHLFSGCDSEQSGSTSATTDGGGLRALGRLPSTMPLASTLPAQPSRRAVEVCMPDGTRYIVRVPMHVALSQTSEGGVGRDQGERGPRGGGVRVAWQPRVCIPRFRSRGPFASGPPDGLI
jgi:hypothetical protein